jgi:Helix-turn-helix of insertion element transposase
MKENGRQTADLLTAKQTRALLALLEHPTLRDAAAAVGIGETTLWRWSQEPEFKTAYMSARREAVKQSIAHLQSATGEAVTCLRDVMKSTSASDAAKVSAARAVLEMAMKSVELEDLAERVKQLEALLEPKK